MYLMIDNYDSFVYNLKAYFEELGRDIRVKRCDELTLADIEHMELEGIILSPGPKRPQDAALCMQVVQRFGEKIPILGVCLGHQVLGICAGAHVEKGAVPMHGQVTKLYHHGTGLFAGLPSCFDVTRYHSLVIRKETLPAEILTMVESGTLIQWRKYPNIFFVPGVDKARIIWDERKRIVAHKFTNTLTDTEQRKRFAEIYNRLFEIFNRTK